MAFQRLRTLDFKHLDFEDEGSLARNHRRVAAGAVAQFVRDDEGHFGALAHEAQALVPALDDLASSEAEGEGLLFVHRFVKDFPIDEHALVEDAYLIAVAGRLAGARFSDDIAKTARHPFCGRELLLYDSEVIRGQPFALGVEGSGDGGEAQQTEQKTQAAHHGVRRAFG